MIDINNCVVYDVEVLRGPDKVEGGWDNPEAMGFASAVAYDYGANQYRFYLHEPDSVRLKLDLDGRHAITFNGIKFDSRVVLGNDRFIDADGKAHTSHEIGQSQIHIVWNNTDLLLEYIKARFGYESVGDAEKRLGDRAIHDESFSLDGLAEGTFGLHKTGHGAKAPDLYAQSDYAALLEYNLHDVRLTKMLFDFILKYGFVVDRKGRVVRIEL